MAAICHSPNHTAIQLQACVDFFARYSAEEYADVLELPERVQVVTNHRELAKCFDKDDNTVCADSGSYHYLVLLDAHDFDIPGQIVARAEQRYYSLKGVSSDTTIRLSWNINISYNHSGALLLFHKTRQLILDGIHWDIRENNVSPRNADDEPLQVDDLAIDVRNPTGPVIIRGNTFGYTGWQTQPFGFINIRNPDVNTRQPDAGRVEIRDNLVHSAGLYHNQEFNDLNDTSGTASLFFIECRNPNQGSSGRCEKTFVKIIGNVFTGSPIDPDEGEAGESGLVSEPLSMTASANPSPGETSTAPEASGVIVHSAIELKNIGQFVIKNNHQKDRTALANIRIAYDDQQDITVGRTIRVIKDNVGHAMPQGKISPTITLVSAENNRQIINVIQLSANDGYTLRKQLAVPELADSDSLPTTSSRGTEISLNGITAGLVATAALLVLACITPDTAEVAKEVLEITSME